MNYRNPPEPHHPALTRNATKTPLREKACFYTPTPVLVPGLHCADCKAAVAIFPS